MPKLKPTHISPTDKEEEAIQVGIANDPDSFELDDEWFRRARPASEVHPELVKQWRQAEGKPEFAQQGDHLPPIGCRRGRPLPKRRPRLAVPHQRNLAPCRFRLPGQSRRLIADSENQLALCLNPKQDQHP